MDFQFGLYPFPPESKKPLHIRGELIKYFIYPAAKPHFSDINYLYVSTDKLTVGTWQLGPGGNYNPPDLHAGDEVYYVLDGVLTEHNPLVGEFTQVKKGEALLLPMHGYHKGYNFEQKIMRILYVIAPKIWEDQFPPMDFEDGKMKMYKGKHNDKMKKYAPISKWNQHGTTDGIRTRFTRRRLSAFCGRRADHRLLNPDFGFVPCPEGRSHVYS